LQLAEVLLNHEAEARPPEGRLENLTLRERVHAHLREEILSNRLPAGTELQETALAAQLGVSRGPLREAIGRLAAEGLVVVRPRRGAVVRALTKEEFLEAYQVREALEVMAARLAALRLGPDGLARLQELTARMSEHAARNEVDAFFEANAAFHRTLVEASGNGRLAELYAQLLGQMNRYRRRSLALRGTLRQSVAEHRAILKALDARDPDRAAQLMAEHIRVPQQRLEDLSEEEFDS
jgi:DNA-binding GntR family transcriptional regulator